MTIAPNQIGGYSITQKLVRPVVYLDHWAVRLFSDDGPLQKRFIEALHQSEGTWLFSNANIMEFIAMTDLEQAASGERLLLRAMPALYVADTTLDKGFRFVDGVAEHPDAPDQHWLLHDLGARAAIVGGAWNTHRFLQDAINAKDQLLPIFDAMKGGVSQAVMALTKDERRHHNAVRFKPAPGMTLRDALNAELIRDPHIDTRYVFDDNDAMDFIHAVPAAVVADLVLLDAGWCHKVERATKRLRRGGVKGKLATCYSKRSIDEFLVTLESWKTPSSG
jgi:hypothetical protein